MAVALLSGCSAYNTEPKSIVLPSSNKSIDIVQHRSDVRFTDCGTLTVLQTYNADGRLIDSKEARGQALHCAVLPAIIDAGGRVGAASVAARAAGTTIRNVNQQAQGQLQGQIQSQQQTATGGSATYAPPSNPPANGGNDHGNNGGGNGDNDGTNPGTDNHHNNGDNH